MIRFGCFFDAPPDQWHLGLECIAELMDWGAVLVVDIIQRINNEVFNRPTPMAAIKKTLKKEAKLLQICTKAYATLPTEKKTVSKFRTPYLLGLCDDTIS